MGVKTTLPKEVAEAVEELKSENDEQAVFNLVLVCELKSVYDYCLVISKYIHYGNGRNYFDAMLNGYVIEE